MNDISNQVLTDDARTSDNFFKSDRILQQYLNKYLSKEASEYIQEKLAKLGAQAAVEMDHLSQIADKEPPVLKRRDKYGNDGGEVIFNAAYWELVNVAAESEMFYVKYDSELRKRFNRYRHSLGFAAGQLYAMSELGVYCPLCMTDGAAHLVDIYAPQEIRERLLPKLSARSGDALYTGAMFLTEKSGGSDVGRNLCRAEHLEGNRYHLQGEKWFCSNVNADVMFVLARTDTIEKGTRGLSLFLVEKELPDGSKNPMDIIRLKDKLGVRSMATGEVRFENTIGTRIGKENNGFKLMAEMINISRTYNSVAALAGSRRAIIEAWQYLNHRITFGKRAAEHALIRQKFLELGSVYLADFLLVWRAIRAMDSAENGDSKEQQLRRILTPMAKWISAENSVYIVRECMELMGGNGYIEDFVIPKLLRDVNVLPIWEGSGNIIVLDMLRASQKLGGLYIVIEKIREAAAESETYGDAMDHQLKALIKVWQELEREDDRETVEATAKPLFRKFIHLFQMALMIEERDESNREWIDQALEYMISEYDDRPQIANPKPLEEIRGLIGWDY